MLRSQDKTNSIFSSIDWWTVLIYLLLLTAGWISVVGAGYDYDQPEIFDFSVRSGKQLMWIGCSLGLGLVLLLIDDRVYDAAANMIYAIFIVVLIITPFIAKDIKGSHSWISLGPVSLQPAEFAKCATALALARYMGSYSFNIEERRKFMVAVGIVVLPILCIILQRETGSALVYFAMLLVFYREGMSGSVLFVIFTMVVYFVVGIKFDVNSMPGITTSVGTFVVLLLIWLFTIGLLYVYDRMGRHIGRILSVGLGVIVVSYILNLIVPAIHVSWFMLLLCVGVGVYLIFNSVRQHNRKLLLIGAFSLCSLLAFYSADFALNHVLQPHQQQRVKVLLGLEQDLHGAGYNVHQSEIAIGSGGFFGKGFLNGTQTKLKYVPEQDTDFIFCTVGEEHGFLGSAFVLLLFLALILRLIAIAERQTSNMARIYGYCVLSIFLFHLFINVGMVMGITPVIGIPLPFFSYGGSSLWGFTLLLFIFLRMDAGRNRYSNNGAYF